MKLNHIQSQCVQPCMDSVCATLGGCLPCPSQSSQWSTVPGINSTETSDSTALPSGTLFISLVIYCLNKGGGGHTIYSCTASGLWALIIQKHLFFCELGAKQGDLDENKLSAWYPPVTVTNLLLYWTRPLLQKRFHLTENNRDRWMSNKREECVFLKMKLLCAQVCNRRVFTYMFIHFFFKWLSSLLVCCCSLRVFHRDSPGGDSRGSSAVEPPLLQGQASSQSLPCSRQLHGLPG